MPKLRQYFHNTPIRPNSLIERILVWNTARITEYKYGEVLICMISGDFPEVR